ncbi:unnamed protein product [Microthlaspi erraticum]|uniref:Tetratricopeptide repeat protein 38 n=1 Tax=Microthlaspi erraticum TaxID=1685480 RepID=A0A6D2I5G8_9BRAS|nr:unnamed protein product [Microthlaspi erraticum]
MELRHLAEAEKAARKGYEINRNDSWAHHCLCHVLQTQCRFKEAVEFMEGCSPFWDSCSSLRYSHNWSHVALCYLEGGSSIGKVQEIYDHQMCKELQKDDAVATDVYMDALRLLLRFDTRDKLDQFLDRLKILANCLTDQFYDEEVRGLTLNLMEKEYEANVSSLQLNEEADQCGIASIDVKAIPVLQF